MSIPLAFAQGAEPAYTPGEVIIKFKANATQAQKSAILADLNAAEVKDLARIHAKLERISGVSVVDAVARYSDHQAVEFIEPNYILSAEEIPNDPRFSDLWGLHNTGQTGGTGGADISAVTAWDIFTGSPDVLVGVIDTGVDYLHPDLAPNIYVNAGEIPGNGVDDDGNGFVDDVRGWDFRNNDNDPMDDAGHGTHVSGTIGAIGNNGIGVAGVNWNIKIMPLKFLGADGFGSTADAISCVEYATMMGVRLTSNSWGGGGFSEGLRLAIADAGAAGILFVAAAGNSGSDNDLFPHYPSSYTESNIVAVAATDHNDTLAGFSCFGATSVDLAAPGVGILSTVPGGSYAYLDGTSMATPHVSGVLALIFGRFPAIAGSDAVGLLFAGVDPVPSLAGRMVTGGRLNAFNPIAEPDSVPPAGITDLTVVQADGNWIRLAWTASGDDGLDGAASRYEVRYATFPINDLNFNTAVPATNPPDPAPPGSPEQMQVQGLNFTTPYYFALKAFDEFGNSSPISNVPTGTTIGPPDIAFSPSAFSEDLVSGGTATHILTLENLGAGELVFELAPVTVDGGGASAPTVGRLFSSSTESRIPNTQVIPPQSESPYDAGAVPSRGPIESSHGEGAVSSGGLSILLLHSGGDVSEIRSHLAGFSGIDAVDVFDATVTPPTPETLLPYHAVIVIVNQPLGDPGATGDALADYADTGGGVILTLASFISGWQVEGRFLTEGYSPFNLGSGPIGSSSLGSFDPTHPIMDGVTAVGGDLLGAVTLAPGAELIAQWNNSQPFVATQGTNVVAVNIFVGSTGFWTGDLPLVLGNAALWGGHSVTWLSGDPASGVIPSGGSVGVVVTFDAAGLNGGSYDAVLEVSSNDPDESTVEVPAHLSVTGAPDIGLSGEEVRVESVVGYIGSGSSTSHLLPVTVPPAGGGWIDLLAEGDYGDAVERATARAEGTLLGSVGAVGTDCAPAFGSFPLSPALLASLIADSAVGVGVQNSADVNDFCSPNRHTVRLRYAGPADHLDFGGLFVDGTRTLHLAITNLGTDLLSVSSIVVDNAEFELSLASVNLAPGESEELGVTFHPLSVGLKTGTLTLTTNDPDEGSLSVTVSGEGLIAPEIGVSPTSLSEDLFSGETSTQVVTLTNTGGSALTFSVDVNAVIPGVVSVPFAGLSGTDPGVSNNPPPEQGASPPEGVVEFIGAVGDFEALSSSPVALTCVVADPTARVLYGQANGGTGFYRYRASTNTWETLASAPLSSGNNGGAALLNGKIYTSYTENPTQLGVYDIATNSWTMRSNPLGSGTGNIASDGSTYLYLVVETSFVRLDPATASTTPLSPPPFYFEPWGGLRHLNGVLYGHQGNGGTGFARYTVATNSWSTLASLPGGGVLGADIDPGVREYFAYGSYGGTNLYRYSIDSGVWSVSTVPFFTLNDGGLGWLPAPAGVYFVQGQGGNGLARLVTAVPFLSVDPPAGTVPPAGTLNLNVHFDATDLIGGNYDAVIAVNSNDPDNSTVEVPAHLSVTGIPDVLLSSASLDFGTQLIGDTRTLSLIVTNQGTDPLVVSGIDVSHGDYTVAGGAFTLPPGDSRTLGVQFAPTSVGTIAATMTIHSNDPDTPAALVALTGVGLEPPDIEVSPLSLTEALLTGATSTRTLTIGNTGLSDLHVVLDVENAEPPLAPAYTPPQTGAGSLNSQEDGDETPVPTLSPEALSGPRILIIQETSAWGVFMADVLMDNFNVPATVIPSSVIASTDFLLYDLIITVGDESSSYYNALTANVAKFASFVSSGGVVQYQLATQGSNVSLAGGPLVEFGIAEDLNQVLLPDHPIVQGLPLLLAGDSANHCTIQNLPPGALVITETAVTHLPTTVEYHLGRGTVIATGMTWEFLYEFNFNSGPMLLNALAYSLDLVGPSWLSLDITEATVPPGGVQEVAATFDATGLNGGLYHAVISMGSNDPDERVVEVPAELSVTGAPDIGLSGEEVSVESVVGYTGSGSSTTHQLPVTIPPAGGGSIDLLAEGDYGDGTERATATAEGTVLGSVGSVGVDCSPASGSFPLSPALLSTLIADGVVRVDVQNSPEVNDFCLPNRHTVRLRYASPADHVDFGGLFLGLSRTLNLVITNLGTDLLNVSAIVVDNAEFELSLASVNLAPGASEELGVTFRPVSVGPKTGTLTVTSNDPDEGSLSVSLSGEGLIPPEIGVAPTSLSEDLFSGETSTQVLTLTNTGGSALTFTTSANAVMPGVVSVPFAGLSGTDPGVSSNPPPEQGASPQEGMVEFIGAVGDFEVLSSSPAPMTCVVADPVSGMLYGQANSGTGFYRYRASSNTWEALASAPLSSGNNGGAALLNGKIYTSYTGTSQLGVYDIAGNSWTTRSSPLGTGTGNIASDGSRYLYLVVGTNFMRLDPVTSATASLTPPPFFFEPWGGLRDFSGVLYGHQGNGTRGFARYTITTNTWTTLPLLPSGGVLGADIDRGGREYIAYGSYGGTNLYRYSIDSGVWSVSTIPFFTVNDGGLGWLPAPVGMYFVQGEVGNGLARLVTTVSFLSVDPQAGTVPPAGTLNLNVRFDATGLSGGSYDAVIAVASNDPDESTVEVPAHLSVTGAPIIRFNPSSLNFGDVFVGLSRELDVVVQNVGTEVLSVSSVVPGLPDYTTTTGAFTLIPYDTLAVRVRFRPVAEGDRSSALTFTSNDPHSPATFPLIGTGVLPPVLAASPDSLVGVAMPGGTAIETLRICNPGGSDLEFSIGSPTPPPPPFPGPKIAAHVKSHATKAIQVCQPAESGGAAPTNIPCSGYVTQAPTLAGRDVYIVVAGVEETGVLGASYGIDYDPVIGDGVDVQTWTFCGDGLEFPSDTWPASGAGIRLSWITCQERVVDPDGMHAIAGAFYLYAYSSDTFQITENIPLLSGPELLYADCNGAEVQIPVTAAGSVRFSAGGLQPGFNPCLGGATVYAGGGFAKEAEDHRIGSPVLNGRGGPDRHGYRWTDSDEPDGPAFQWVDITGMGTQVPVQGDDANSSFLPIGFPFPFYGNTFDHFAVCTNGWISFTSTATHYVNQPNPASNAPENVIAPFWDDLIMSSGKATYHSDGSKLIVQFQDVYRLEGDGPFTFQAILYPDGSILYQYLSMRGVLTSATVGIQNGAKDDGLTVGFNTAYLHDNLAIRISTLPSWLTFDPSDGVVPPSQCVDVNVMMNATGLVADDYTTSIVISSNDPFLPNLAKKVLFHVGTVDATHVDVDPNSINPGGGGRWITASVELPPGLDPADIVLETVRAQGTVPADVTFDVLGDFNENGTPDRTLKFDRGAFIQTLPDADSVEVVITGEILDTIYFVARDTVRVLRPHLRTLNTGGSFIKGTFVEVGWDLPPGWEPLYANLFTSLDDGATWEPLASGVTGESYFWRLPDELTESARVSVYVYGPYGLMGVDKSDQSFTITNSVTGVAEDTPSVTALLQNAPNPFSASTIIRYDLKKEDEVVIRVFDVSGRMVRELVHGWMPPGRHQVTWDGRSSSGVKVSSGLYSYRMETRGYSEGRRMFLLR